MLKIIKFFIILKIIINFNIGFSLNLTSKVAVSENCDYISSTKLLTCASDYELDIKQIFADLDNLDIFINQKELTRLDWNAPVLNGVLPENVFGDFEFIQIKLIINNCEIINPYAFSKFNSTNKLTRTFQMEYVKLHNNLESENNIYRALTSMSNLGILYLYLDPQYQHEILDKPFPLNNWHQLVSLTIKSVDTISANISRIGDDFMSDFPDTLMNINLENLKIDMISSNAFKLKECLDCPAFTLTIESCQLSENNLEQGVFNISGRQILLRLYYNKFQSIPEDKFSTFLKNNDTNTINFNGNPLLCSKRNKQFFYWILKDSGYTNRILGSKCSDGTPFWNFDWGDDCQYDPIIDALTCHENFELDIKQTFIELARSPNLIQNRSMQILRWDAPLLDDEIPEDVFSDFQIDHIYFTNNSKNLAKIHTDAFSLSGKDQITEEFLCPVPSKLRNYQDTEYDIYKAFMSMIKLKKLLISLDPEIIHEIPNNIFTNNSWFQLSSIIFKSDVSEERFKISIENCIYYLPRSITSIVFDHVIIKTITRNAFQMKECLECDNLNINFISNQLDQSSFEHGSLDTKGRGISLLIDDNNLEYLDEDIFGPFLSNNLKNTLLINNNPINCSSEQKYQFDWILNHEEFKTQTNQVYCSNGDSIWEFNWGSPTTTVPTSSSTENKTIVSSTKLPDAKLICNSNGEYNGQYDIESWPAVQTGEFSVVDCPNGDGKIRWMCLLNGKFDERGPNIEECWLDILLQMNISSVEDVEYSLKIIVNNTVNSDSLKSIKSLNNILKLIIRYEDYLKNETINPLKAIDFTKSFILMFSQIIDQSLAWDNGTENEKLKIASQLLLYIQLTAFTTNCYLNENIKTKEFISKNIYEIQFFNITGNVYFEYNQTSMRVPELHVENSENAYSCRDESSFGAVISVLNHYLTKELDINEQMNTEIIAFSFRNFNKSISLKEGPNVKIRLKHKSKLFLGDRMSCVYWDFSSEKWSSEGCHILLIESDRDQTVCECNHLTNFAAIMDLSGRETNGKAKNIVTLVFCSLSALSLVITILFIIKRRKSLKSIQQCYPDNTKRQIQKRDFIFLNQSICLLVSNLIIMIGLDRTEYNVLCNLMSFLLLYFLLSTFIWISLHGFQLFQMTNNVFSGGLKYNIFLTIGYILPLFISLTGISIIWKQTGDIESALVGSDYFCWISSSKHPNNIWILICPVILVMLFNIAVIWRIWYSIRKAKNYPHQSCQIPKIKSYSKETFGFLFLAFNLGLNWTLFLSYMQRLSVAPIVFSYLFIVINGSQGIFNLLYYLAIYFK